MKGENKYLYYSMIFAIIFVVMLFVCSYIGHITIGKWYRFPSVAFTALLVSISFLASAINASKHFDR